jgi:lysophospholipid acyltransferase (LPLAT)-like uncharacterized protein
MIDKAWRRRAEVGLLSLLAGLVLRLVYRTLRVRWSDAAGVLARRAGGERFIFAAWHDTLILLPLCVHRVPSGLHPCVLISQHRDGEIAARAAAHFGVRSIRGSSTRGGVGAVRGLLAAHGRGEDVLIVPDGPRGPRHEAKMGIVQLGRVTGAAIVPVALATAPRRRLRSWDRMQVPRPFGRVEIRFGTPVSVEGSDEDVRARVQAELEGLGGEVEGALGLAD